jgi:hypothetical protein
MRNFETVLYNLAKQAENREYRFERLIRHLYNPDFYRKALSKANTTRNIGHAELTHLIEALKTESFAADPERIDPQMDQLVQKVIRLILETIYEPIFSAHSHGFRQARSCHTALQEIALFRGTKWWIKGSLKDSFTDLSHHRLLQILQKRIKDQKFLRLLSKYLSRGVHTEWKDWKTFSGVRPGGILSPILSNIYMHELDQYINDSLSKKGERFPKIHYVRYADQFLLGIQGSKSDAKRLSQEIAHWLKDELKIQPFDHLIQLVHHSEAVEFLGYQLQVRTDGKIAFSMPKETSIKWLRENQIIAFQEDGRWRPVAKDAWVHLSDPEILICYNRLLKRIYRYFSLADNLNRQMSTIKYAMEYSCLCTLAKKHKSSVRAMRRKLSQGKEWGIKQLTAEGEKWISIFHGSVDRSRSKGNSQISLIQSNR